MLALCCFAPLHGHCGLLAADSLAIDRPREGEHPLAPAIRFAEERRDYISNNIRDYKCRLIKRERIDGVLQKHHFLDLKVRSERTRDGEVLEPFSVFLRYLAPRSHADRRILFVDGEHDGLAIVRKGGSIMSSVKLHVAIDSKAALRESRYPITEIGLDSVIDRLLVLARQDMERDPDAENTSVRYFENARIGERACMRLRVEHSEPDPALSFHKVDIFIDNELKIPARFVVWGWPPNDATDTAPILEEYTYVNLELNVGLTDDDFRESVLE